MKILIADDHTLFRDTLVEYIKRADANAVVKTAPDINTVVSLLKEDDQLDLVLLDLRMPGMKKFKGLQVLRKDFSHIPLALISGLAEKQDVQKALELGAVGYFSKTLTGKAMLAGINKVISGEEFISIDYNTDDVMPSYYGDDDYGVSPSTTKAHLEDQAQREGLSDSGYIRLTPREEEVLRYLCEGQSNQDIADHLGLKLVTIKLHVGGICRKLKASNRTQAVLNAQKLGLVTNQE